MVYEKDSNGKPIKTKNEFALESLQHALRLGIRPFKVCFDSKYYVTNATGKSITSQQIVKEYRDRWKIEVFFRNLKQLCHEYNNFGECQNRKIIAQKHYVYACIHALMLLERQNKRSLYEAKKYFQQKFIVIKHNGNKALRLLAA